MRRSEPPPPSLYATHRPSGERLGWKLSSVESEIGRFGPLPSSDVSITRRTPDHSSSPRKNFPSGDTASAYLSRRLPPPAPPGRAPPPPPPPAPRRPPRPPAPPPPRRAAAGPGGAAGGPPRRGGGPSGTSTR